MKDYKKLRHYGIIGDLNTCALVGRDGSIDWCCFPHIGSPSIFAGILDIDKGGYFAVRPSGSFDSEQQYIGETNVLKTTFHTSSGIATLLDFMPLRETDQAGAYEEHAIYRKLTCSSGSVDIEVGFKPRFNYAKSQTTVEPTERGVTARGNSEQIFLNIPADSQFRLQVGANEASGSKTIKQDDTVWLVLHYNRDIPADPEECEDLLKSTIQYWQDWVHKCDISKCVFGGPWHDLVVRSSLVLKLLLHEKSGAIYAAPTTSLPEIIGGVRNWDYRFAWIRDGVFTVQSLYNLGYITEAKRHLGWFTDACRMAEGSPEIQPVYRLHEESDIKEQELYHLSGYLNSRPVRIGNGAVNQKQLDIYGELIHTIYETTRYGEDISGDVWNNASKIINYICGAWNTPDRSIWETRGKPQHYVYSKLMCWVALDRGIKIAKLCSFEAPLDRWEKTRDEIRDAILQMGFNRELNSFVQVFDSDTLDATGLLVPIMGFLPFDDPRVQGTIDAIFKRLGAGKGLVYRYDGDDGLPGKEGAFVLCSFWLVDALALSGRINEAEELFKELLRYANPLGLLAEEIDPGTDELLGNFPQAFSHIGLINSALYLGKVKGREQRGPEPLGVSDKG